MRTNFIALILASVITSALCTLAGMAKPWPVVIGVVVGTIAGRLFKKAGLVDAMRAGVRQARLRKRLEESGRRGAELRHKLELSQRRLDAIREGRQP